MYPFGDSASSNAVLQHSTAARERELERYYTLWHATERAEAYADKYVRMRHLHRMRPREAPMAIRFQKESFSRIGKQLAECGRAQHACSASSGARDVASSAPL